jgi:hypothetical protein
MVFVEYLSLLTTLKAAMSVCPLLAQSGAVVYLGGWRLFYKLRAPRVVLACAVLHCPTLSAIPEKPWIFQEKQTLVSQVENE